MGLHRFVLLILIVGALLPAVGCKKKRAATPFDLSNPKAAAVTFARSLENGDLKRAKAATIASGMELDLVESMAHAASNLRKLYDAAEEKFGASAAQDLLARSGMSASEGIAAGQVVMEGDYATVMPRNAISPVPLKRIRGLWKVDIGALIKGQDMSLAIPTLRALGTAADRVSGEVSAGKYASVEEVKAAMGTGILSSMGQVPQAPTSTPTTAPTIDPRQLSPAAKDRPVVEQDDTQ